MAPTIFSLEVCMVSNCLGYSANCKEAGPSDQFPEPQHVFAITGEKKKKELGRVMIFSGSLMTENWK
jgi:hypothetical protein